MILHNIHFVQVNFDLFWIYNKKKSTKRWHWWCKTTPWGWGIEHRNQATNRQHMINCNNHPYNHSDHNPGQKTFKNELRGHGLLLLGGVWLLCLITTAPKHHMATTTNRYTKVRWCKATSITRLYIFSSNMLWEILYSLKYGGLNDIMTN